MARKSTVPLAAVEGEARIDLSPLSHWLNALLRSDGPLPRRAYSVERLRLLCETLGILSFQGIAQEITCLECEVPHPAIVNHDCGRYFYHCLLNGEIELKSDDIRLFATDRDALFAALAHAANLATRNRISYAEERLIRLGFVRDEDRIWPLAYADDLTSLNVFAAMQEVIEQQFPDGPGLIATPSIVHMNVRLPRSYRLIPLHELFFGQTDQFGFDWQVALTHLGRRKKNPGSPGRPTKRKETRRIRSELRKRGLWPSAKLASLNARGAGVFVCINATDLRGRGTRHITRVRAIWQDDDHGWQGEFPLIPSLVVSTSPGRFQRLWLCDGLMIDQHRAVQERLASSYAHDRQASDLSRVLRLPGFRHMKNPNAPHVVRLVEGNSQRYSVHQILMAFPPIEMPLATPPRAWSPRSGDDQRVADALRRIPADDRETWLRVGMALRNRYGDAGRAVWDEWSSASEKFDPRIQERVWRSFRRGGIGVGTIFHLAGARADVS